MIYREYLVMRKALAWFVGVLGVLLLFLFFAAKGSDRMDFGAIVSASGWLATIFASIFGVALGNGSREAARVLWVLPSERWKLGLQIVVVDLIGTTVAFAVAGALMLAFLALSTLRVKVDLHGTVSIAGMLMPLAMAYAVYGWSALIGMVARRVAYAGIIALPALMIWMVLAHADGTLGAILRAPIVANPLAVFNSAMLLSGWTRHHFALNAVAASLQWLGTSWGTPVLAATAAAACGLAVMLWQRAQIVSA